MSTISANALSHIKVDRIIDCSFSFAVQEAESVFRRLEKPKGSVCLVYRALGLPEGEYRARPQPCFRLRQEATQRGRPHEEMCFDWLVTSLLFVDFSGSLRLCLRREKTYVCLEASYTPPYGIWGKGLDRVVIRKLVMMAAQDLLSRLAVLLERSYRRIKAF